MRRNLFFIFFTAFILLLIACSGEQQPAEEPATEEVELDIEEILADEELESVPTKPESDMVQVEPTPIEESTAPADEQSAQEEEEEEEEVEEVVVDAEPKPLGPSPVKFNQQASSFGGGGGATSILPNNCLEKHHGIVYYDQPAIVESLMESTDRTLQIPYVLPEFWEVLPDICACGFEENEEVSVAILNPENESLFQSELISQPVTDTVGDTLDGAFCVATNVISEFDFLPEDSFGTYRVLFKAESGEILHNFELLENPAPSLYYSKRKGGYIADGLDPNETITVLLYEPSDDGPYTVKQDHYLQVSEDGNAVIENEFFDAPMAILRGDPTSENFDVLMFYNSFITLNGFIIFYASIDWSNLHNESPNNPFLYYHQSRHGQADYIPYIEGEVRQDPLDKAIELNENFSLAYSTRAYRNLNKFRATEEELLKAMADFDQAILLEPDLASAILGRAVAFMELGIYDSALIDIEAFINLEPEMPDGYFYAGCINDKLNDFRSTASSFDKWLELKQKSPDKVETPRLGTTWECEELLEGYAANNNPIDFDNLVFNPSKHRENHPKDDMPILYVPAGEFLMGSLPTDHAAEDIEQPQHAVDLDAFWIDAYEVAEAQYFQCIEAGACSFSNTKISENSAEYSSLPVTGVTWNDSKTYCEWAGRRLPTEAEWEKAARGADGRAYPWGNGDIDLCDHNVNYNSSGARYLNGFDPMQFSPGCAARSGAIDMIGNVWEWVSDYYSPDYYSISPSNNPAGPESGDERVLRGGGWTTKKPDFLRAANRWSKPADYSSDAIGFRCAMDLSP